MSQRKATPELLRKLNDLAAASRVLLRTLEESEDIYVLELALNGDPLPDAMLQLTQQWDALVGDIDLSMFTRCRLHVDLRAAGCSHNDHCLVDVMAQLFLHHNRPLELPVLDASSWRGGEVYLDYGHPLACFAAEADVLVSRDPVRSTFTRRFDDASRDWSGVDYVLVVCSSLASESVFHESNCVSVIWWNILDTDSPHCSNEHGGMYAEGTHDTVMAAVLDAMYNRGVPPSA
ncbi:uncharacterized protein EV422DRAFT_571292 [Fimicolochytrium jonesii]|uniref:uncharacterized protein n=1 Tax=Fimicolochytrium jonesii TaxID=1396493 RepID=UPI0022FEA59F|nr:uncharacterized protein EV422DRAFT_571292 [Fimicolochytrium jonesii]KAI8816987.1 hypothetical protein EV422DRAFT_571292 [Fimicolochytrium jonesii]